MTSNKPPVVKQSGFLRRSVASLFRKPPAMPGESYGVPGAGSSMRIGVITSILLIASWWLLTAPITTDPELIYMLEQAESGGDKAEIASAERDLITGDKVPWIEPLFLPSPGAVFDKLVSLSTEPYAGGTIWEHLRWSIQRVAISFLLACLLGIPIGIAMGVNRVARGIFDPPIEFYRPIPPLGYLPLTIIWLGIDESQKLVLIFLAAFAPMALSARAGVRSVAIEQIHAAYSMGATRFQVVRKVIVPGALPEIFTGMRISIGFAWTTVVAAELVAAEHGIGHMVLAASEFLNTAAVVLGVVLIGLIAYAFDMFMRTLEKRLVPWKGRA